MRMKKIRKANKFSDTFAVESDQICERVEKHKFIYCRKCLNLVIPIYVSRRILSQKFRSIKCSIKPFLVC